MNVVQENLLESKVEIQSCDPCVNRVVILKLILVHECIEVVT
jgi:hypothetical protein